MNNLEYRPIAGYEGIYEISNTGIVRSLQRVVRTSDGRLRRIKSRIMMPKTNADGYLFYSLSKDGVTRSWYMHRLVAAAFIPNPENLPEVNHKGLKTENTPDLLEWCTHQYNVQHCFDTCRCKNKGGNHHFAVGVIDNYLGQEFETIKEWCAARGINYSTGRNIISGCNQSKTIDLSAIVKKQKIKTNE